MHVQLEVYNLDFLLLDLDISSVYTAHTLAPCAASLHVAQAQRRDTQRSQAAGATFACVLTLNPLSRLFLYPRLTN